ncbi:MAG TPA: hypothetical protein GXZ30_11220 [Propionibacterium sp.]|nr:hypothetical protein [Propionibacterium sp.]
MSGFLPEVPGPSVLPEVRAESRSDGTMALVRDPAGSSTPSLLVGGAISVIGLVLALTASFPFTVFPALMLVVGVGLLVSGGFKAYRRKTLGEAELVLPRLPLRMGEPVIVRYSQRRTGRHKVASISAVVSCLEWVRYQQGTTTSTQTRSLWEQPLPQGIADPLGKAELLRGTWQLRLPSELPPSFSATNNAINWRLTIKVEIEGHLDINNTFVLPVAPEVVRDLR